jgi:hypothetical protein
MKCSCGRPYPPSLPILGIQYDYYSAPAVILFNCICNSTRGIRWADATEKQRVEARLAELSRDAESEMQGWGGP